MLIDTHCHLNFQAFADDLEPVIKSAHGAGIEKIINVGADLLSSQKAIEIAQKHESCFAAVGIHPHHADKLENSWEENLAKLAKQPKVIAIGECGLDYYEHENGSIIAPEIQKQIFLKQLRLAQNLNLPVIIHSRQAHDDVVSIIHKLSSIILPRGVFHCYSAGKNGIEKITQLGFYFGIDGNLTYDPGLQKVISLIPLEKILLETDSPWLTPVPFRSQRNEPKNVRIISEWLARIKNTGEKDISQTTSQNATELFNF
ncbi:MAG: TatD family hydrolase [Patescibacteria group bacterium]|nr:TatD family hydrolase [Patescibacteria group bacterium]MCL5095237.1 TatD family hydrolase [Patescibacteria group bacterium]